MGACCSRQHLRAAEVGWHSACTASEKRHTPARATVQCTAAERRHTPARAAVHRPAAPGTAWLIFSTPCGSVSSRSSRRCAAAGPSTDGGAPPAACAALMASPGSFSPYSCWYAAARAATAAWRAATSAAGTASSAVHSRAMALRLSPPASEARTAPGISRRTASATAAAICTALPAAPQGRGRQRRGNQGQVPCEHGTAWPPPRSEPHTLRPHLGPRQCSARCARPAAPSPPPARLRKGGGAGAGRGSVCAAPAPCPRCPPPQPAPTHPRSRRAPPPAPGAVSERCLRRLRAQGQAGGSARQPVDKEWAWHPPPALRDSSAPAHPTYTAGHSSVSRLSSVRPRSMLPSSPNAPVRPVSSSASSG